MIDVDIVCKNGSYYAIVSKFDTPIYQTDSYDGEEVAVDQAFAWIDCVYFKENYYGERTCVANV